MTFRQFAMAQKRAYASGCPYDGQFSPMRRGAVGAEVTAANYCMLLDGPTDGEANRFEADVAILANFAESLNRQCDSRMVDESPDLQIALACFASRMFFDATKLKGAT